MNMAVAVTVLLRSWKVSCAQQCFAAVTRGGGLHTWGLDDGSGRLGHGPRPNGKVRNADQDGTGGAEANTGAGTGENALVVRVGGLGVVAAGASTDGRFQLKGPSRVMALLKNRVMQVGENAVLMLSLNWLTLANQQAGHRREGGLGVVQPCRGGAARWKHSPRYVRAYFMSLSL